MDVEIKVINRSKNPLPEYKTAGAAGMDLVASPEGPIVLPAGERALVPTGLFMEIPEGFEAQVRPRSGLALKHGLAVLNSPGTIDSDYRGEIKVLLINHSTEEFIVRPGERIAQIVFAPVSRINWKTTELLTDSERGTGGYGSTGRN